MAHEQLSTQTAGIIYRTWENLIKKSYCPNTFLLKSLGFAYLEALEAVKSTQQIRVNEMSGSIGLKPRQNCSREHSCSEIAESYQQLIHKIMQLAEQPINFVCLEMNQIQLDPDLQVERFQQWLPQWKEKRQEYYSVAHRLLRVNSVRISTKGKHRRNYECDALSVLVARFRQELFEKFPDTDSDVEFWIENEVQRLILSK